MRTNQLVCRMPEIVTSGGTMLAPYQMGSSNSRYGWRGRTIDFGIAEATDGFKDVLGLQVVEGRWFDRRDDGLGYQPVVINEDMKRGAARSGMMSRHWRMAAPSSTRATTTGPACR